LKECWLAKENSDDRLTLSLRFQDQKLEKQELTTLRLRFFCTAVSQSDATSAANSESSGGGVSPPQPGND
jgi:hypothetical protein